MRRIYPVSKGPLGPGASPQRNGHPDRQPIVALYSLSPVASKRSITRHLEATGQRLPKLTSEQKEVYKKMSETRQAHVKDQTPPFTEAVPNPPLGPAAERIVAENIAAAEQRGATDTADGYVKQVAEAVENTAAPDKSSAPDAAKPNAVVAPKAAPEVVTDKGSSQQGKAPPAINQT